MSSSHLFFSRLKRHLVSATQFLLRHCKTWLQLLTLSNSTWLFCYLHPTTHVFRQTPLFCCWLGSAFRLQASASSLLLFPFLFLVGTELNTLSIYKKVACRGEPPMRRNEMSAPTKWTAAPTLRWAPQEPTTCAGPAAGHRWATLQWHSIICLFRLTAGRLSSRERSY
jgi:hypothetical protein